MARFSLFLLSFFSMTFAVLLNISSANANESESSQALQNIFNESVSALASLTKTQREDINSINMLIKDNLLPKINVLRGSEYALKAHWQTMSLEQQTIVQDYIVNSLINDYAAFLVGYEGFNQLKLAITDNTQKENKAIITVDIINNDQSIGVPIAFKMIKGDEWQIYDLIVSGVSLMKSFRTSFASSIKRKGLEKFIEQLKQSQ